eukprot:m.465301 g.465301  ORF g.465301 m.465301 type:complete len:101 (-) comp57048_c3_seq2:356-658(-)
MTWCVLASRFGQPLLFFLVATRQDNGVRPRLAYAEDLILVARAPPPPVHQPYMPAPAYSAAPPPPTGVPSQMQAGQTNLAYPPGAPVQAYPSDAPPPYVA